MSQEMDSLALRERQKVNPYSPPEAINAAKKTDAISPGQARLQIGLAVALVVLAVATRPQLQPGSPWWNFTPMVAVALFAGAFLRRAWAFAVPLVAMGISDVLIAIAHRMGTTVTWGFHWGMLYVYPAFILVVFLGMLLRRPHEKLSRRGAAGRLGFWGVALAGGIAGSLVFFLVTNFGSWIEYALLYKTYELTASGLINCYIAGLAFYRQSQTLFGDLIYTGVIFGVFLAAQQLAPRFSERRELVREAVQKM